MKKETKVKISKTIIGIYLIVSVAIIIWAYFKNPVGALIGTAAVGFLCIVVWSVWTLGANSKSKADSAVNILPGKGTKCLWDQKATRALMDDYDKERVIILKRRVTKNLKELRNIFGIVLNGFSDQPKGKNYENRS